MAATPPANEDPKIPTTAKPGKSPADDESPYDEILKSSAWIGGASVLSTLCSMLRVKALAVLLGPAGFGLVGVFSSILDLARGVAGSGIALSGVRQVAEAKSSGDGPRLGRTIIVLRRLTVLLAVVGAIGLAVLSPWVSQLTFSNREFAGAIALLAIAVFFRLVADGQSALIQGTRQISNLAKANVAGALLGAIASIAIVYAFRQDGIVPSLIAVAAASALMSWWYSRRIRVPQVSMTAPQIRREAGALLKLGFAFMTSSFLMLGASFAAKAIVLRFEGLDATGFFQAAWTLGSLYSGYVYQAIYADFYPRLVGVAHDNDKCNRVVNEQTRVSLLLAVPGTIATIVFAQLAILLFYSSEFVAAIDVLRWICLGALLKAITQPMGYIIVAKGRQSLFIATEVAWTVVNVALTWLCVMYFGLAGAGAAFFASFVFYYVLIYPIARRLSGFRWSRENKKTTFILLTLTAIAFGGFAFLPPGWALGVGVAVLAIASVYAIRSLLGLVSVYKFPRSIQRILLLFRLTP